MQMTLAGIAIAMTLLPGIADAQANKAASVKPKAPVASQVVKPARKVVPNPQIVIPQPERDAEAAAYSDLVDNVSESMDQFMDDNTTGNEGRDHLSDSYPDESADDAKSDTEEKPRR